MLICQTPFTPQNSLTTTFNNVYYYISITRKTTNQTLQWCISSLDAIISSCIVNEKNFGGLYREGDELYNISNSGYPSNQDPLQIPLPSSTSLVRIGPIGYPTSMSTYTCLFRLVFICPSALRQSSISISHNHNHNFECLSQYGWPCRLSYHRVYFEWGDIPRRLARSCRLREWQLRDHHW